MRQTTIDLLKDDHGKMKDLLEQLDGSTERTQKKHKDLLEKCEQALSIHIRIEGTSFYPAFRVANGKDHKKMYFEVTEEHRAVEKLVLPDLEKCDSSSEKLAGRARVLQELVQHHISDEKEDLSPQTEDSTGSDKLEELGRPMGRKQLRK